MKTSCCATVQPESTKVDCQMSSTESCCDNDRGSILNGQNEDSSKDDSDHQNGTVDYESIASGTSDGQKGDPIKDDSDPNTSTVDEEPVPGTSKSSGAHRRSSKEPKRSLPDPVAGCSMMF